MSYNMQSGIDKVCSDIAGFLRYKYRLISIEYKGQNFIIGGEDKYQQEQCYNDIQDLIKTVRK